MSLHKPRTLAALVLAALALVAWPAQTPGQQKKNQAEDDGSGIAYKRGPLLANLGTIAQVQVPPGYKFVEQRDMKKFDDFTDNLFSPGELGAIVPENGEKWFIVFEFEDIGYVKDDEKDDLDADALLESLMEANEAGNAERRRQGKPPLTLTGWAKPPFYDAKTNNLTWATRLRSGNGGEALNYQTKLLGRGGVMNAVLVMGPEDLDKAVPQFDQILTGFAYKPGQKYAEWRTGDKVAAYGLAGLVTGGVLVAAAKSGFLGKMIKPLLVGGAALCAAIGAFFKKMFGMGKKPAAESSGDYNPFNES